MSYTSHCAGVFVWVVAHMPELWPELWPELCPVEIGVQCFTDLVDNFVDKSIDSFAKARQNCNVTKR